MEADAVDGAQKGSRPAEQIARGREMLDQIGCFKECGHVRRPPLSCPGRSATRSVALLNRDPSPRASHVGPGSAVQHRAALVLHCARGTRWTNAAITTPAFPAAREC